jgi:hypothetical protein
LGESPQAIGQTAQCRYADAVFDDARRRLILVREDHRVSDNQPTNTVAAVAIDGSSEVVLVEGNDFYSNPRQSPAMGAFPHSSLWRLRECGAQRMRNFAKPLFQRPHASSEFASEG